MKVGKTLAIVLLGLILFTQIQCSIITVDQNDNTQRERKLAGGHNDIHHDENQTGHQDKHHDEHQSGHQTGHHDEHHDGHHDENDGENHDEHHDEHHDEQSSESVSSEESGSESSSSTGSVLHVQFKAYTEAEHLRSYKKISADMKVYEDEYTICIREIPNEEYTEEKLDECLGKNFIKVTLDLKYIILKVMAKADTKIRTIFINDCYAPAGVNEEFSNSCDFLERDILEMLWSGLDFLNLIDLNKSKYLLEYGKLPQNHYNEIFEELHKLSKEFFELLDELDSHKEVTILRLKTLIDDRTKLILEEAQNHPGTIEPTTVQHRIDITETMDNDDGSGIELMPATQFHAGTMYSGRKLPMVNNEGDKHNSLRSMNGATGYNQLNGNDRSVASSSRNQFQRNQLFKQITVDRLGKTARAQGKSPFKNIHTTHFSRTGSK